MPWFLIEKSDRLESIHVYYDTELAQASYTAAERRIGWDNAEKMVCLFSADSLGSLAKTHPNWLDVDPDAAHQRLETALFSTKEPPDD